MKFFKTKKQKEKEAQEAILKQQQLEEENKQKQEQAKLNIKRIIKSLERGMSKFDQKENQFIQEAVEANASGDKMTEEAARQNLKFCMSRKKFAKSILQRFNMTMQTCEMNDMFNNFVTGFQEITQYLSIVPNKVNLDSVSKELNVALNNNLSQYDKLNQFLEDSMDMFDNIATVNCDITDQEIDDLISAKVNINQSTENVKMQNRINNIDQIAKDINLDI